MLKKLVASFLLIGFLYIAYGLYISLWRPRIFALPTSQNDANLFYDYSGAINIRTTSSSGSGLFDQVTQSARNSGLDFIIITDFNDFNPDMNRSPYSNNVLTLNGGEYSYLDARILNLDIQSKKHLHGPGRSQVIFSELLSHQNPMREEGLFVLAHPFKPGYRLISPLPKGLDGIEIINLKAVWQETWLRSKLFFIWTALIYPFNSDLAFLRMLAHTGQREIDLWDKFNSQQPTMGFFGSAAEARLKLFSNMQIPFPSYETVLSLVRNHVLIKSELTGQADSDRKKISAALRRGQFYMSFDLLADPTGFHSYIQDASGNQYLLGSEVKYKPGLEYKIHLPTKPIVPFEVHIYKDGEKILSSNSADTAYAIHGPGVYRAVVRVRIPMPLPDGKVWMNWVLTNPIYVK